jgi:hypothetical protein
MMRTAEFAEKAKEAEALAALATDAEVRLSLEKLAKDYWALAKQETNASLPGDHPRPSVQLNRGHSHGR